MATEKTGSEPQGLVRRTTSTISTMFDESASTAQRAGAATKVAVGTAGVAGTAIGAVEGFNLLVVSNPVVSDLMHTTAAHFGEVGLIAGGGATVAAYAVGFGAGWNRGGSTYSQERTSAHNWVGRVRITSAVVAGATAILAAGIAGMDGVQLAHLQGLDAGLIDTAAVAAAGAGAMTVARLVTRIGAARPQSARELAE